MRLRRSANFCFCFCLRDGECFIVFFFALLGGLSNASLFFMLYILKHKLRVFLGLMSILLFSSSILFLDNDTALYTNVHNFSSSFYRAYFHSTTTLNYIRSLLTSGFASLHNPRDWSLSHVRSPALRSVFHSLP